MRKKPLDSVLKAVQHFSILYTKPVKLPAADRGISTQGVILYLAFA